MAQDVSKIAFNLSEFNRFICGSMDKLIFANLKTLVSVIVKRIEDGVDADGRPFSEYSDVKYNASIFDDIDSPRPAQSFIDRAIKEKKEISYLDIRKELGFKNRTHNYSFSGNMLKSVDIELVSSGDGNFKFIIKPKDNKNFEKLIQNEDRENEEILEQSEQELQNVTNDLTEQILDNFERILNQ